MGSRRFLFAFGLGAGILAGALISAVSWLIRPESWNVWSLLASVVISAALFTFGGYVTWFSWAKTRANERRELISRLSQGDLSVGANRRMENQEDLRRLIISLRRAMSQVQRVSGNVHRTCKEVGEQARMLLEAARRQGGAVDRSLGAVGGMGESLQSAGKRVHQLETFAQDTTGALSEMTERIEQVASALTTLNDFAHKTSDLVLQMSDRLTSIVASGDALLRFANEAGDFVQAVEGGIDAVRRRANETGDLAREVTTTAERGQTLVGESVKGMYQVEETIRKAAVLVDALGDRSAQIGRIVDVIQEIADQ